MLAKKCYFVGIFILFSLSLAIADPPAVNPATGEPLMIDCLRGTVTVDGDLSDWNLEAMTPAVLDAAEHVNSASWDNAADCSGEVYLLWDDVNIYIAAVIKDDKLSMNKTDGNIWNADAVEVFFSTLNAVADHSEHYQYGFNANNQKWNWCNMDGAGSTEPAYLQIASSVTADGYICEASVEYALMPALDFSAGNTIGFHPCIDDTDIDDGDTEYQMTWTGLGAHDQSTGFGHMLLSDEAVPASDGWQSQDIDATDGSVAEVDGTWTISGEGADVWGTADQFHYVYKELTGDAVIVARVVDNGTGSNNWAKGGVMIRQSTDAGSTHALMAITGSEGGGGAFQWRPAADGASSSAHDTAAGMAPGYWVKLERTGNALSGSYSADGVTWTQQGDAQTIEMADPVLIGLFVTSHADGEIRTYTFDNVSVVTMFDVTAPGDVVKGVPDEVRDGSVAGWPDGEYPGLAVDDDVSTKFLHFAGEVSPTGFVIEPAAGVTIVTGLTFTTANDAPERDPISFELSGSNDSIDGPYTLIASGDIVDFAMEAAWPRFTMNATPIEFENDAVYKYYQVMFPAVRDAASANSMQIAEVELLGVPGPDIILVSGIHDFDADGVVDDFMLLELLEAQGYKVDYQPGNWTELDDAKIAALNAAGLVIISRTTNSGDYNTDEEPTQWNSITTPMLMSSTHLVRSSRWKWVDSTSILNLAPAMMELADGTQIAAMDEAVGLSSFIDAAPGNGTVLATGDGLPWIIEWEAGVEYYDGAGQTAGGPRVFFTAGTQELLDVSNWGQWNLTPDGEAIYLDIVDRLINPPPVIIWVSFHGADDEPAGGAAGAGFTEAPDKAYTDLLTANGYNVTRYITTSSPDPDVLNAADLVITSRSVSSGGYQNDGATAWNGITAPMIITGGYTTRSSRMGFTTGGTMVDTTGDITLTVTDPAHPIFAGIALTDGTMDNPFAGVVVYPTDGVTVARGVSVNNDPVNAEGTVLATVATASDPTVGGMVIAEWQAGATLTHDGGAGTDILAGHRLVFLTGAREADGVSSETAGLYDLYEDGAQMLLNAVAYMLP